MTRYLDYNDTYLSLEPAHPSDNIPAAWAVGQVCGANPKDKWEIYKDKRGQWRWRQIG